MIGESQNLAPGYIGNMLCLQSGNPGNSRHFEQLFTRAWLAVSQPRNYPPLQRVSENYPPASSSYRQTMKYKIKYCLSTHTVTVIPDLILDDLRK